jgi:hypothetical protein
LFKQHKMTTSDYLEDIEHRINQWGKLGHHQSHLQSQPSSLVFQSLDAILDETSYEKLLNLSPRGQRDAMDDTFLEDLDHPRNRKLKRQFECLANIQPHHRINSRVKWRPNAKPIRKKSSNHNPTPPEVVSPSSFTAGVTTDDNSNGFTVEVKLIYDPEEETVGRLTSTVCIIKKIDPKISDVLQIIARKLQISLDQLISDFSARDSHGAFLGLDDPAKETVILRARSLSV